MARKREIRPGTHLYHDRTGDYLGQAIDRPGPRSSLIHIDGRRTRGGHPVQFATIFEVKVGPDPDSNDPA